MRANMIALILLATSNLIASSGEAVKQTPQHEDPFLAVYQQSVSRMSQPDTSFEAIPMDESARTEALPVATSKTCSQRCSTTCSVSCTTTRGCSTRCKAQTEGCSGGQSPEKATGAPFSPPTTDQTTFNVQRALVFAGYHLCADGQMNAPTRTALADFQERKTLTVTSAVDPSTWAALLPLLQRASP
jgi:Putative peptidoglycan binding domain